MNKKVGTTICLIKPNFEASRKEIKKGGLILDKSTHKRICDEYYQWFSSHCKMNVIGITESPIKGPKGNKEFLIAATYLS